MTIHQSTPKTPTSPVSTVNKALNLRMTFFKSLQGHVLAATFDSAVLAHNPQFVQITADEYSRLVQEQRS